ncbi:MAG: DUF4836 family protein [Bacteroidales bacterium]|nr:DUF4836 family protein [Bacteroidales bacterium]
MKRFFISALIVISAIIALSACGRSASVKAIPDDTFFAVKIAPGKLIDQAGIQGNKDLLKILDQSLGKEEYAMVKKIVEDPSSTGVKVKDEIVLAVTPDYPLLIIPLSSADDFANFLKKTEVTVHNGKDEILYYVGGDDPDYVQGILMKNLAVMSLDRYAEATELKEAVSGEVNIKDDAFDKFASTSDPFAFWFSMDALANMPKKSRMYDSDFRELKALGNSSVFGGIKSEKGEATLYVRPYLDKDLMDDMMADVSLKDLIVSGSDKYFKYMPENPLFVINGAMPDLKKILENPQFGYQFEEALDELGLSKNDVKKMGGGTFTLAGNAKDVEIRSSYYSDTPDFHADPSFAMAIECDEKVFRTIANKVDLPKQNGAYYIEVDPSGYFFYEDGAIIFMTEDLYRKSRGSELPDNLAGNSLRKKVADYGMLLNFQAPEVKKLVKALLEREYLPSAVVKLVSNFFADLDVATLEVTSKPEIRVTIKSNSREYFPKLIVDMILAAGKAMN